ncbi:MAG: hypothetical protein AB8B47_00220 [Roseobacter sp.]
MPRWVWFAPFGLLVVVLAAWGFRLGWIAATISETDVIEGYTVRYLETFGAVARATDCVGRPGESDAVWIVVTCAAQDGQRIEYPVDRFGRLLNVDLGGGDQSAPQT